MLLRKHVAPSHSLDDAVMDDVGLRSSFLGSCDGHFRQFSVPNRVCVRCSFDGHVCEVVGPRPRVRLEGRPFVYKYGAAQPLGIISLYRPSSSYQICPSTRPSVRPSDRPPARLSIRFQPDFLASRLS